MGISLAGRKTAFRWDKQGVGGGIGLVFTLVATLAATLAFASPAGAAPPTVSMGTVSEVSYTSAHVKGEVDAHGESTEWYFQVSTDEVNWEIAGPPGATEGAEEVEADLSLKPGTTYFVRLAAFNYVEFSEAASPAPYAEITTKDLPAPTVTIEPVGAITGTTAHFSGHIDPNAPAGNPAAADVRWHFQCTPECPGIAADQEVLAGEGNTEVEVDATGLEPNTTYEVELIATNAGGPVSAGPVSFKTDPVAPSAATIPAVLGDGGTISLGGRINPHNSATHYWVEYGSTAAYGTSVPLSEDADAGSGGAAETFTQEVAGLDPDMTYHFQIVAENATGRTEGGDRTFTTPAPPSSAECPNAAIRAEQQVALPACRAYELVSRGDGNFGDVLRVLGASDDGERVAYDATAATDSANSSMYMSSSVSTRSPTGWTSVSSDPLAPALLPGDQRLLQPLAVSSDFSKVLMSAFGDLVPDDGDHGAPDLYLIDVGTGAATLVSIGETRPDTDASSGVEFVGASRDLSRIYFRMTGGASLVPGAFFETIYEWNQGQLEIATLLPGGAISFGVAAAGLHARSGFDGAQTLAARLAHEGPHTVSDDGSTFYWKREGATLTVSRDGATVQIAPSGTFVGASHDGDTAYFVSNEQLTGTATPGGGLYRYEVPSEEIELLSPDAGPGGLGVVDTLMSDDASHVYFLATAALAPGAEAGVPNLYLYTEGETRFLFAVPGGGRIQRASRDGRFAVIQATASLGGASVDGHQSLYEYDDQTGRLACASCRADGSPSQGDATLDDTAPPLLGQFVQMSAPRNISGDGRIFFATTDRLVAADATGSSGFGVESSNNGADVYEYADGTVSLLTTGHSQYDSFVADSGDDGRNVFITTRSSLLAEDEDEGLTDIYAVRIGGGYPMPSGEPSPCVEDCQSPAGSRPATGVGSASLEGDRNGSGRSNLIAVAGARSVRGATATLRVKVGGPGMIKLSGPEVLRRSRPAKKGGTYRVDVSLDRRAKSSLRAGDAVKTTVTLTFLPSDGTAARKKLSMTFKPRRNARPNGGR